MMLSLNPSNISDHDTGDFLKYMQIRNHAKPIVDFGCKFPTTKMSINGSGNNVNKTSYRINVSNHGNKHVEDDAVPMDLIMQAINDVASNKSDSNSRSLDRNFLLSTMENSESSYSKKSSSVAGNLLSPSLVEVNNIQSSSTIDIHLAAVNLPHDDVMSFLNPNSVSDTSIDWRGKMTADHNANKLFIHNNKTHPFANHSYVNQTKQYLAAPTPSSARSRCGNSNDISVNLIPAGKSTPLGYNVITNTKDLVYADNNTNIDVDDMLKITPLSNDLVKDTWAVSWYEMKNVKNDYKKNSACSNNGGLNKKTSLEFTSFVSPMAISPIQVVTSENKMNNKEPETSNTPISNHNSRPSSVLANSSRIINPVITDQTNFTGPQFTTDDIPEDSFPTSTAVNIKIPNKSQTFFNMTNAQLLSSRLQFQPQQTANDYFKKRPFSCVATFREKQRLSKTTLNRNKVGENVKEFNAIDLQVWSTEYEHLRKALDREQQMIMENNLRRIKENQQIYRKNLKQIGPHIDIYKNFHGPVVDKIDVDRVQHRAAIIIQKYVRGFLLRRFLQKLCRKAQIIWGGAEKIAFKAFIKYYFSLIKRIQNRAGIRSTMFKKAPINFHLKEIERFLDDRRRQDLVFDGIAFKETLEESEIMSFFNQCKLYPSKSEMETAVKELFRDKHSGDSRVLKREEAMELIHHIYKPAATGIKNNRKSTWIHPIIDGIDGKSILHNDKSIKTETPLSVCLRLVVEARKGNLTLGQYREMKAKIKELEVTERRKMNSKKLKRF